MNNDAIQRLQEEVDRSLHGQHLAQTTVVRAVRAHLAKQRPSKALVMSFHGWTGTGKNYFSKMIAQAIYQRGMRSNYVHLMVSTLHFSRPEEVNKYKAQIQTWISGNLTECAQSLFIFDEVDKMPPALMDAIVPYIDFHDQVNGLDPRRSIFLFLSNGGSNALAQRALENHRAGRLREELTLKETEEIIRMSAFNEDGGLKTSRLVSKHLVDYYIPFLPLERSHVVLCFRDYLNQRGAKVTREQLDQLADSLHYFPREEAIYSVSGCKQVEKRADFMLHDPDYLAEQHRAEISAGSEEL